MDKCRNIEDSIRRALDLLEHPGALTDEELRDLLEDEECLRACRDLTEGSRALMTDIPSCLPDVGREWDKWTNRHCAARRRRLWRLATVSGVAALLVACILLVDNVSSLRKEREPVAVFQADERPQLVTLQTENGRMIALNASGVFPLPVAGVCLREKGLDYHAGTSISTPEVRMHTLSTPRGEDFKVVLSDGTEVWLNAESRLEYPSSFVEGERVVTLRGEAYFKVARDETHPFVVQTDNMRTRVLGTEFNVRNYSVTDSHVTLIQGSVEVSAGKGGDYTRIAPGEDACLQPDGGFDVKSVDVDGYVYWKEGFFYFDNVTLLDIMQSLGRWYNVTILFENQRAMNYRMHFLSDRKAGLLHAVKLLNRMKKVKVDLEKGTLVVR